MPRFVLDSILSMLISRSCYGTTHKGDTTAQNRVLAVKCVRRILHINTPGLLYTNVIPHVGYNTHEVYTLESTYICYPYQSGFQII